MLHSEKDLDKPYPEVYGLPCPVNDMMIVVDGRVASHGEIGEVYLRGPNVMKGTFSMMFSTLEFADR